MVISDEVRIIKKQIEEVIVQGMMADPLAEHHVSSLLRVLSSNHIWIVLNKRTTYTFLVDNNENHFDVFFTNSMSFIPPYPHDDWWKHHYSQEDMLVSHMQNKFKGAPYKLSYAEVVFLRRGIKSMLEMMKL